MTASQQPQLFDPGERSSALSVRQFMGRATWHATERKRWPESAREKELPVHHGTVQAAADRARLGFGGHGQRDNEYRFHPVVADEVLDFTPFDDDVANIAASDFQGFPSVAPNNAKAMVAREALERGQTVAYRNEVEDPDELSYVSPPHGFRTLEDTTNFADLPRRENFVRGADIRRQGVKYRGNRFDTHVQPPLTSQWGSY